ncbi:hypothetical protein K3163_03090 [Qipengyuania sp. 1NDW9]|uniref:Uncharacterized protein n=1 Tax=Qipengyuania xiapuensis TaxID=2867236 RepID=A0ABX9A081_9SPHN|nr:MULTISPECIES: hypothetical protein [Qipengyuania]MBX7492192.1 hypothetical protein [Qipengyuania xiapuensis]MBY6127829.1 hypothetical protein [Qipengyuania aquimaris]QZD93569.1 hypothetical protein K3162_06080 [Qipengyuania xiapuensis]
MNKFAIPALAAVIALGACAEADAPADDGTDTVVIEEPAATETVVAEPVEGEEGSSVTIDGADVDATISEDGVQANIDAN